MLHDLILIPVQEYPIHQPAQKYNNKVHFQFRDEGGGIRNIVSGV